jgi:hypothetical protein
MSLTLLSFDLPMGILYAISILAFCALLWAALSIARHVRKSRPPASPNEDLPHPPNPRHAFEASGEPQANSHRRPSPPRQQGDTPARTGTHSPKPS